MTPRQKLRELCADTVIGMSSTVVHLTKFHLVCYRSIVCLGGNVYEIEHYRFV